MVTHMAARQNIQVLQQYFIEQGFRDTQNADLDMCTDEVFAKASSEMKIYSRLVCGLATN